jgi:hypothetical protein
MSTLKVDTILKRSGTGTITLGQSGDTISVPTGASLSLQGGSNGQALTTNGSGTLSFATVTGNAGTEIVYAERTGGNQTLSDNTWTKVEYNSDNYDPDSNWDTTNDRYIAPSAGRYYFTATAYLWGSLQNVHSQFYLNGSNLSDTYFIINHNLSNTTHECSVRSNAILNLSANDYVEFYAKSDVHSGSVIIDQVGTQFLAFRLD